MIGENKKIKITLKKSLIGCTQSHKDCAKGLGFKKREQTVEVLNTLENIGMINKIRYLLKIWS